MLGKNFSVFSMYFGANSAPVVSLPTSLARSMILSCPSFVEEAGVAGLDIAVGGHCLGGRLLLLEIAGEHARRAELHLAGVGDADIDVGRGRPDRIGAHRAVLLAGDVEEGFGLAVELLQIDAERAEEGEQLLRRSPRRPCRRRGSWTARARSSAARRPADRRAHRRAGRTSGTGRLRGSPRHAFARRR